MLLRDFMKASARKLETLYPSHEAEAIVRILVEDMLGLDRSAILSDPFREVPDCKSAPAAGAGAAAAIEAAGSSAIVCCNAWGEEGFTQLENNHPIIKCMAASSPITQAKDAIDAVGKLLAGEELPKETLSHSTLLTAENINDFDWESIIAMRGK